MIDCGAGESFDELTENIASLGLEPDRLQALILTHCHIDHTGAAHMFKKRFGCEIIAHLRDSEAILGRDKLKSAASWYALDYQPVTIDTIMSGEFLKKRFGDVDFNCVHTPGHTPGSISVYCDLGGTRILFGQDIHGPFDASFGSNLDDWKLSMHKLLELDADILCEGHYGVYQPKSEVRKYIEGYLERS
jgi:glyoxylase-like metal-dependent hydrolase (beta-lactamase superfamily II)